MAQNPIVTIEMEDGGKIVAELYPEMAPISVNNFISLVKKRQRKLKLKQGKSQLLLTQDILPARMMLCWPI